MIELMIAAALVQAAPPPADPCNAVAPPEQPRQGCPQWRFVGRNETAEAFVDPASVRPDGSTFRANLRIVYYQDLPNGIRSGISRMRFDCARRTTAGERMTLFDAGGGQRDDGPLTGRDAEPYPAVPGEPGAALLDEFCPRTG
jgi:hypothetical protein